MQAFAAQVQTITANALQMVQPLIQTITNYFLVQTPDPEAIGLVQLFRNNQWTPRFNLFLSQEAYPGNMDLPSAKSRIRSLGAQVKAYRELVCIMRGKEAFKGTQHRLLAEQYDNTQRQVFCWVQKNAIYRQVITWMHNVATYGTAINQLGNLRGMLQQTTTVQNRTLMLQALAEAMVIVNTIEVSLTTHVDIPPALHPLPNLDFMEDLHLLPNNTPLLQQILEYQLPQGLQAPVNPPAPAAPAAAAAAW